MSRESTGSRTATVMVEVCTRPRFSVSGIRCHLWPPGSFAKAFLAPGPEISRMMMAGR